MLTLTFLGVGSAFAKRNLQSNALIEAWSATPETQDSPDDVLLVDFGTTGPLALHRLKQKPEFSYLDDQGCIRYPAIARVFITHQHSDHIGGLEELAGMNTHCYRDPRTGAGFKPQLVSSTGVFENLWEHSLRGGLGVLGGRYALLDDYFDILALHPPGQGSPDGFTMLERYEFTVFPTDHVRLQRKHDWPSVGLLVTDRQRGDTVFYSGDTRFDPKGLGEMMASAKMIFHEVQLEDQPDSVHATLSELRTLPEPTRRKMLLFHYGDTWDSGAYDSTAAEFAGLAQPLRRYTLFE